MLADDEFVGQVRDALAHLYDYPYLQTHPLVENLHAGGDLSPQQRMRFMRTAILEGIEAMNPGRGAPARSTANRAYDVLKLHYVEGLMVQEVARELALSERQVYRDLRKAEAGLAGLLWSHHRRLADTRRAVAPPSSREQMVLEEANRLDGAVECVALRPLVAGAVEATRRLALEHAIEISCDYRAGAESIYTIRQVARQVLVHTLSHAVQSAGPDTVLELSLRPHGDDVQIQIIFTPETQGQAALTFPSVPRQLIERFRGQCSIRPTGDNCIALTLTLRNRVALTVLVIDDNQGLIELFRRYLADSRYHLIAASDGDEGLRLANEAAPDMVILDVMMPQQDGWEILQRLQADRRTQGIPVIVCSVFDDPQLALSLGASAFLAKPVSRSELLTALSRR